MVSLPLKLGRTVNKMDRITDKMLQYRVDTINELLKRPKEPWTKRRDGSNKASIGNFHLSGAYGRTLLHEMVNEGGGVNDVFGLCTKRELFDFMGAFIKALSYKKAA
jgi:hypothetical protein